MDELSPFGSHYKPYFTPCTMQFALCKYKCITVPLKGRVIYDKQAFTKIGGQMYKFRLEQSIYYIFTMNLEISLN